jgi:SAM-dependent methyltransferase
MISLTTAQLEAGNTSQMPAPPPASDPRYFPKAFDDYMTEVYSGEGSIMDSYRTYMRTDIERGRMIVKMLAPWTSIKGKNVLDIGCGYGGLLLTMRDAGAASIAGVEVEASRLHWANVRFEELGVTADLRLADICSADDVRKLDSYDVILAQDVIEHVMDPSVAIRHISQLLRPEGIVFVQVGNKFSPNQLLHDHHCQLPGLTMLSREQAVEYFQARFAKPKDHYAVGYWREEKYYRNVFRSNGVALHRTEHFPHPDMVNLYGKEISDVCKLLEKDLWPDLRPELGKRMRRRMLKIVQLYVHASRQLPALASQPNLLEQACDHIVARLLLPAWRLVGIKKSSEPPASSRKSTN